MLTISNDYSCGNNVEIKDQNDQLLKDQRSNRSAFEKIKDQNDQLSKDQRSRRSKDQRSTKIKDQLSKVKDQKILNSDQEVNF